MRRRRRLEITVETSRLVVRRGENQAPVWCTECAAPVRTVTPEEAAALACVSTGTVYRRAGAGRLHFIETAAPSPLICLNSLLASADEGGDGHAAEHTADHHNHD